MKIGKQKSIQRKNKKKKQILYLYLHTNWIFVEPTNLRIGKKSYSTVQIPVFSYACWQVPSHVMWTDVMWIWR